MKFRLSRTWVALALSTLLCSTVLPVSAAMVDGSIATGEYRWDTTAPPNSKWYTRNGEREVDDGSGGNKWDINFLGTDIMNGQFHVGASGGSILSGANMYASEELELSDIAINVVQAGEIPTDPAADASGWDYALRLIGIDSDGNASFNLFGAGSWTGSGKGPDSATYMHENHAYGSTQTFRMEGDPLNRQAITGKYTAPTNPDGDDAVLEVSLDLGLLSLFDEKTGGKIITYLTMSCVNDEAIVEAHVSPVPVPSAVWLFGSALLGFISMSRRTRV